MERGTDSLGLLKGERASMSQIHKSSQPGQTGLSTGRARKPVSMEATWERTLRKAKMLEEVAQERLKEPTLIPTEARMLRDILSDARIIQSLRPGRER